MGVGENILRSGMVWERAWGMPKAKRAWEWGMHAERT